jgi:hypothetical protein
MEVETWEVEKGSLKMRRKGSSGKEVGRIIREDKDEYKKMEQVRREDKSG